jgi:hypothetical protein
VANWLPIDGGGLSKAEGLRDVEIGATQHAAEGASTDVVSSDRLRHTESSMRAVHKLDNVPLTGITGPTALHRRLPPSFRCALFTTAVPVLSLRVPYTSAFPLILLTTSITAA